MRRRDKYRRDITAALQAATLAMTSAGRRESGEIDTTKKQNNTKKKKNPQRKQALFGGMNDEERSSLKTFPLSASPSFSS
jgi:hypothetical protein